MSSPVGSSSSSPKTAPTTYREKRGRDASSSSSHAASASSTSSASVAASALQGAEQVSASAGIKFRKIAQVSSGSSLPGGTVSVASLPIGSLGTASSTFVHGQSEIFRELFQGLETNRVCRMGSCESTPIHCVRPIREFLADASAMENVSVEARVFALEQVVFFSSHRNLIGAMLEVADYTEGFSQEQAKGVVEKISARLSSIIEASQTWSSHVFSDYEADECAKFLSQLFKIPSFLGKIDSDVLNKVISLLYRAGKQFPSENRLSVLRKLNEASRLSEECYSSVACFADDAAMGYIFESGKLEVSEEAYEKILDRLIKAETAETDEMDKARQSPEYLYPLVDRLLAKQEAVASPSVLEKALLALFSFEITAKTSELASKLLDKLKTDISDKFLNKCFVEISKRSDAYEYNNFRSESTGYRIRYLGVYDLFLEDPDLLPRVSREAFKKALVYSSSLLQDDLVEKLLEKGKEKISSDAILDAFTRIGQQLRSYDDWEECFPFEDAVGAGAEEWGYEFARGIFNALFAAAEKIPNALARREVFKKAAFSFLEEDYWVETLKIVGVGKIIGYCNAQGWLHSAQEIDAAWKSPEWFDLVREIAKDCGLQARVASIENMDAASKSQGWLDLVEEMGAISGLERGDEAP